MSLQKTTVYFLTTRMFYISNTITLIIAIFGLLGAIAGAHEVGTGHSEHLGAVFMIGMPSVVLGFSDAWEMTLVADRHFFRSTEWNVGFMLKDVAWSLLGLLFFTGGPIFAILGLIILAACIPRIVSRCMLCNAPYRSRAREVAFEMARQ